MSQHSFIGLILLFIQQYRSYLERTKQNYKSQLLAFYLGLEGTAMDYTDIGKLEGKSSERIRQCLLEITADWKKLADGEIIGNIRLSEKIPDALEKLKEYLYRPFPTYWVNAYFKKETWEETLACCEHFLSLWKLGLLKLNSNGNEDLLIVTDRSSKGKYRDCLSWVIADHTSERCHFLSLSWIH